MKWSVSGTKTDDKKGCNDADSKIARGHSVSARLRNRAFPEHRGRAVDRRLSSTSLREKHPHNPRRMSFTSAGGCSNPATCLSRLDKGLSCLLETTLQTWKTNTYGVALQSESCGASCPLSCLPAEHLRGAGDMTICRRFDVFQARARSRSATKRMDADVSVPGLSSRCSRILPLLMLLLFPPAALLVFR